MDAKDSRVAKRYACFLKHVKKYLKTHNQGLIAMKAGVTRQYLNKLVNDDTVSPSIQVCLTLADVMGKPLGDLLKR